MAQARQHLQSTSPILRLDNPETLDVSAIEAAASQPQREAWQYLVSIFEQAAQQHCHQFSIEPDVTLWRIRYRCVDSYEETILSDPSDLIWALEALQTQLWDENYHTLSNRTARFTWVSQPLNQAVSLRVVQTVNGDLLQFDTEPMLPMPPMLDELHLPAVQLREIRTRLAHRQGMILMTSSNPHLLDDSLMAMNQDMISPTRKILSISDRHRYSLPRTTQIDMADLSIEQLADSWKNALESFHDTVLINTTVPEQFHEQLANVCGQGTLVIQTMLVAKAADSMDMLNASVIRRSPLHRSVTSVINHFAVNSLCQQCACKATLNEEEQRWLEHLRTPVTENVISWLADGNIEQFLQAEGCDACNDTGKTTPLSVFDIIHRDELNHQFPISSTPTVNDRPKPLQRQLMSMAKSGSITLSEVIRVLELAG